MTGRLEKLLSLIEKCGVFADIGCDHGYVSYEVLSRGVADKVYAADISPYSLEKARALVGGEFEGRFFCFVSDGFTNVPDDVDCALIAGMGGEEILHILNNKEVLPKTLVLQPMKNTEKVRRGVVGLGYGIDRDLTFFEGGKYYEVVRAKKDFLSAPYSEEEYAFGRDNLAGNNPDFKLYLEKRISALKKILSDNGEFSDRERISAEIGILEGLMK